MTGRRTLSVEVEAVAIEDGEIPPPRVGSVIAFPLRFVELPAVGDGVVTVRALLEASTRPPIWQYTGEDTPRQWEWSGLLRGDGWTASWRGFRPLTGRVELTGRFYGVMGYDTGGRVRGRVTRVRIVSERFRRRPGTVGSWHMVSGYRQLRDVDAAPRFFDRDGLFEHDGDEADSEVGALIDLDLDDVPDLPARPSIVAGDISAAGGVLWVVDSSLPLTVSVDADHTVHEYVLPGAVGISRRIWATPGGCWIAGGDGLFRVDAGETPRHVDDIPVLAGAALGDTLLSCRAEGGWTLHGPGGHRIEVNAPDGYVASVAVDADGFVVAVRGGDSTFRLVRVHPEGALTVGPVLPHTRRQQHRMFLGGTPLRLFLGEHAAPVHEDLTLGEPRTLPKGLMSAGQVGPFVWFTDHPPDGTGRSGWWPLPGPVTYDRARQFWLFTLLDGQSLEPVTSTPIFATRPPVTIDEHGTVWVIADGIRPIPDTTMQWPNELDIAALLDVARNHTTDSAE
ncbi:hypothetical protein SAMN02745947_05543 [Rhodococcus rhodochrous J3]|uniref:Uncharacterized protein n=2 Tax=Rhodococcus rhodochrous TaxID=1829 RepID=A0ABY1MJP7_RHORH|nr:hypothetical protein [Rhodococcus rhodochrous]MBF4478255.1 hypothetical protein [Rhodococcus rhodochrous]SMG59971.1 hypothetical protein SAMN02745947_05543 [Rhodococcus rhodochrous J3]